MTDAGYVIAAYGVILGGLGLYTIFLWRRLRAVQNFGMTFSRPPWSSRGRDDDEAQ
jgi:hypothetical protein